MEKLKTKLKENKGISDNSLKIIFQQLQFLNNKKPFSNLSFLNNTEEIINKLENKTKNLNTQKTYLYSIVSALEQVKNKNLDFYKNKLNEKIKEYNNIDHNQKNDKEEKNWVSSEDIENIKENLIKNISSKNKKMDKEGYDDLFKLMILSLYTDLPPRRNQDYQETFIKTKQDNKNILDLKNNQFIFKKYKTARTSGEQELKFNDNEKFKFILKLYLKHHPLYKNINKYDEVPFLVNFTGEPLKQVNSITRILNKIFKKNIGSSMLRKIYLSNKYGQDLDTLKEMKEDARDMGHSTGTQQAIYIKN